MAAHCLKLLCEATSFQPTSYLKDSLQKLTDDNKNIQELITSIISIIDSPKVVLNILNNQRKINK